MLTKRGVRRGYLKALAALFLGVVTLTAVATPAQAQYYGRGRWGYGGYGGYGRFYPGPRFYGPPRVYGGFGLPYGGYGPGLYGRGFYPAPYVVPAPIVPVRPFYGGFGFGYGAPIY